MRELLIATKNPGKFEEIAQMLEGLNLKLLFLGSLEKADDDFIEDGITFEENSRKKAAYYHQKTGLMTLGEDSGIIVEALKEQLGVKTRRFGAGENAGDKEWLDFFMKVMEGHSDRRARFVCAACLFDADLEKFFYGETVGKIADEIFFPIKKGIPLSSVFVPENHQKVYSQLSLAEKNALSHRGKAMSQLRNYFL